jgi:D-methionine transport system substrate-binding protein
MEPFMAARRAFLVLGLAAMALAACSPKAPKAGAPDTLIVGATAVPHAEMLEFIKPKLAAQGLNIEIKVFNDYVQPNTQVAEKRHRCELLPDAALSERLQHARRARTW